MNQADYRTIKIERRGRILYLIMNRPATLNAVDALMHTELARVFRDANDDTESDIVVLTGAGRAFCAGGDVDWMQDAIDHPENFESTVAEAKQIVFSLLDCEKPTIAKVNGAAVGLGATLALFCDIGFAAETAIFADPHVSIGMVAGDAEVDAFVDRLAGGATQAIRWTKVTANIALKQLAHSMMDTGLAYEALTNISADHRERVQAFRERSSRTASQKATS